MITSIKQSSYLQLPDVFYQNIQPSPINHPTLIEFNTSLSKELGLNQSGTLSNDDINLLAGNVIPVHLPSIALAYAGHQYGHYVPLLGDGRAILIGEVTDPKGLHWDVQLKGSGTTKYSRQGDGRAPLSAVLREYMISEAMFSLGVPTTRSLAAIASTNNILRSNGEVPAGVLTRIASSYIRIGSFQFAAALDDISLLRKFTDYTLMRHFPNLLSSEAAYLDMFKEIVKTQAKLIAQWMGVGFIHGVMNTDNIAISGETIDYGPCAFMDEFDIDSVFSSIDRGGRYAYGNQAAIMQWNLMQLGEALIPLFSNNKSAISHLNDILSTFGQHFNFYWNKKICGKLGLMNVNDENLKLVSSFLTIMQHSKPDFTNTFRLLSSALTGESAYLELVKSLGGQSEAIEWVQKWQHTVSQQNIDIEELRIQMDKHNPAYIPRNHLVEQAINAYIDQQDDKLWKELLGVLKNPFTQINDTKHLQSLPTIHNRITQTFCGT